MKLINQSAEYLPQSSGIDGIYKQIELAGRTSYLSWDKMTDDSAKKFVDMLIKSKHTSVLEHGTVYLMAIDWDFDPLSHYRYNKYSRYRGEYLEKEKCQGDVSYKYAYYVTTNLRVLVENGWLDDLKYICEPTEFHEKRLSVKVITDIGVTREFNRHRTFSIVEQSTRYCNFSKDKFGNELTFIIPSWLDIPEGTAYWHDGICYRIQRSDNPEDFLSIKSDKFGPLQDDLARKATLFLHHLNSCTRTYFELISMQCKAQEARQVLPLCTKTEVVYTAFESDWRHFFDLRLFGKTGEPHPQMKQLAELIKQEFEKAGVWEGIMKYPSKYE